MRRLVAVLASVLLLLAGTTPALAHADSGCQYILGFATLHALDAPDVGDCLDNQAFASNGDAQQHTTKGLLAWRKADNWTAFTNGYWTWINGPNGLSKRLNTQRYSWEANPDGLPLVGAASAANSASTAPGLVGQSLAFSGIGTTFRSTVAAATFAPDIPANTNEVGYAPPAGQQILTLRVATTNTGTSAEPLVLAADFGLATPAGTRYRPDIDASVYAQSYAGAGLGPIALEPGQSETDYLAFLVPVPAPTLAPADLLGPPAAPPAPSVTTAPAPSTNVAPAAPSGQYPSDITAVCRDGTYSYSAHARGTCSHHGGVATWVNHP